MHLIVFGGNGFVGSAVCRAAIGRGWQVTSFSRSGKPFVSAKGHRPAWSNSVDWRKGSAFDVDSFSQLLPQANAVVHTLGILLESDYKSQGGLSLLKGLAKRFMPETVKTLDRNPLAEESSEEGQLYRRMNYESAVNVFKAFQQARTDLQKRNFFYLSAEDVFRPFIPSNYIATKRKAEQTIERLMSQADTEAPAGSIHPYYVRPSLIYHPHIRPITPLPATILDLSAQLQNKLPPILQAKTLASTLETLTLLSPSLSALLPKSRNDLPLFSTSLANLLSIPPVHVDTIAESICRILDEPQLVDSNVIDVKTMRRIVGFSDEQAAPSSSRHQVTEEL